MVIPRQQPEKEMNFVQQQPPPSDAAARQMMYPPNCQVGVQDPVYLAKEFNLLTLNPQQLEGSRHQHMAKVGHAEGLQEGCVPAAGWR